MFGQRGYLSESAWVEQTACAVNAGERVVGRWGRLWDVAGIHGEVNVEKDGRYRTIHGQRLSRTRRISRYSGLP
jgi:hypothetical protein